MGSQVKPYYDQDGITIYHGDCRELWLGWKTDAVVTDPPYGICFKSHGQWFGHSTPIAGDSDSALAEWCRERVTTCPLAMFYSPYKPMGRFQSVLVWNKGGHVGIGGDRHKCWKRDFELIGIDRAPHMENRDSAVLQGFPALLPPPSGHFAEKPVGLLRYLIRKLSASPTGLVVDPFMGSGTTLRAAKDLGRRAIGIEIEERYCEIAAKRLEQGVLDYGSD